MKKTLVALVCLAVLAVQAGQGTYVPCAITSGKVAPKKPIQGYATIPSGTVVTVSNPLGFRHVCQLTKDIYPRVGMQNGRWYVYDLGDDNQVFDEFGSPFELKLQMPSNM